MVTVAEIVGIASGFALVGYQEPPATLLVTSIVVDLALAPLTAVIAIRRGRRAAVWSVTGLLFGMWALAAVLLLGTGAPRASRPSPPKYPPTSDAA